MMPAMLLTPKALDGTVAGLDVEEEFVRFVFAEGIATMFF